MRTSFFNLTPNIVRPKDTTFIWFIRVLSLINIYRTYENIIYTHTQYKNQLDTNKKPFHDPRENDIPYKCLKLEEGEENSTKAHLALHLSKDRFAFYKQNGLIDQRYVITEEMVEGILSICENHPNFYKIHLQPRLEDCKLTMEEFKKKVEELDDESSLSSREEGVFYKFLSCIRWGKAFNS
ncbi:MAG: hypothetical protein ChlgKO_00560 [Chlamydiales bacterium]